MKFLTNIFVVAAACAAVSSAHAQQSPWSVRTGPARVDFHVNSSVEVAGTTVPGGTVEASGSTFLGIEIGYAVNDDWTARLALGVPPTTTLTVSGTLTSMVPPLTGTLGKVKYGPAVLTANYTLGNFGGFKPYVGAGVNYTMVMKEEDGDVSDLKVKSAFGSAVEIGFDVPLTSQWSLFVDARKVWVKTTATGNLAALGGLPAKAYVTLNPVIVHAGIGYRF